MSLTIVDPVPTTSEPTSLLIFSESSMTSSRLYAPGGSAEPAYVVSSTDGARRVAVHAPGGRLVAEVRYPGELQRLVRRAGSVRFEATRREVGLDRWITKARKGAGEFGRAGVMLLGAEEGEWAWAERLTNTAGSTKVYTLVKGEQIFATFVPTRTNAPPGAPNRVMTRAYIEFTDGGRFTEERRDEVVVSLLVLQHLIRTGSSSMLPRGAWMATAY